MGFFSTIKNKALSAAVKKFSAEYLEKYGELQEVNISPEDKQMKFSFLPLGESEPVLISIKDYMIRAENGMNFFKAGHASSNKEWLTRIMNDYLVEKSIEIPDKYYNYIKLLL